ncbi:hypothetical protein MPLA_140341 [Mesorhizobium sp. ORS 3359]|nr:hypothetical protein MPLA_140341 [Mesorhizobium sp. ORS 3359]
MAKAKLSEAAKQRMRASLKSSLAVFESVEHELPNEDVSEMERRELIEIAENMARACRRLLDRLTPG